jgi:ribosome-interacting GTPase 1
MKISNADVAIRQVDATPEDLIDVIEGNRYSLNEHHAMR